MTLDAKALRALCAEATPGPWRIDDRRVCDGCCGTPAYYHDRSCCDRRGNDSAGCYVDEHTECAGIVESGLSRDVAFIAAARTALPLALDEIDQLRLALTEALDGWEQQDGRDDCDARIAALRKLVTP